MSFPLTPPPDTGEEPIDTPIYLIPLSKSACFSFQLQANQKRLAPSTVPSHISDLEDLGPVWRAGVSNALRLAPRLEITRYILGSDNNSDIVIQTKTEDECWVHSQHCQLIPDPDGAAITVSNTSRTTFTVQNIDKRDRELEILPKHTMSISHSKWYLTLGRGLKILVIVLPPDPDIHQKPLIHKRSKNPPRPRLNNKTAPSSTPKKIPKRKNGRIVRPRNYQGHKTHEAVAFIPKINIPIPTRGTSGESSRRKEIITSTDKTRVFKSQRCGIVVAAKEFKDAMSNSAAKVWENEKAILEHLKGHQHQHIANVVDHDEPLRILYLDYIAGIDLEKRVTPSGFSTTTEVQKHIIWTDISCALEFLHREGVIHNDVKPPNIVLSEERAVLCDFGLATMGPEEHYWGTAPYVSPDILVDEKRSEPSDIWALGVTMLFVIGLIPLPKRSWVIKDITNSESRALLSMSRWLQEIRQTCLRIPEKFSLLRRMLTENREERITAIQLSGSLSHRSHLKVR